MIRMNKTILRVVSLLMLVAVLFVGCAEEQNETTPTTTTPTTTPTQPNKQEIAVEYDHCGLHFKLDSTYSVGLLEDDQNTFTFSNSQLSGTVTFGKLSVIGNGATTSQVYAELLKEQNKDASPWIGTSTGFGYYVITTVEDTLKAECLYISGEYAWLVKAESKSLETPEKLIEVVGRCGLNTDEIPTE
jgi:hypothetical protein